MCGQVTHAEILGCPLFILVYPYHTACSGQILTPAMRDAMTITLSIFCMTASHVPSPSPSQPAQAELFAHGGVICPLVLPKKPQGHREHIWLDQHSYTPMKLDPDSTSSKAHTSLFPRKQM